MKYGGKAKAFPPSLFLYAYFDRYAPSAVQLFAEFGRLCEACVQRISAASYRSYAVIVNRFKRTFGNIDAYRPAFPVKQRNTLKCAKAVIFHPVFALYIDLQNVLRTSASRIGNINGQRIVLVRNIAAFKVRIGKSVAIMEMLCMKKGDGCLPKCLETNEYF